MNSRSRGVTILLWTASILVALGIGLAGAGKFLASSWGPLFRSWGYPLWFAKVTGVLEMAGAIGLVIPRTAFYAAIGLGVVMAGALITLLTHPGGRLGWGATPLVYLIVLALIGWARARDRKPESAGEPLSQ